METVKNAVMKAQKRAYLYSRFSPRPHAEESESCERQEEICREYCKKKGYVVAGVFSDPDFSGKEEERPGLWAALDALRRGSVLVVRTRDRLARDIYLNEVIKLEAKKSGARIEAVEENNGDSPQDKLVRGMMAEIAVYQRRVTAIRTKRAMLKHQNEDHRIMSLKLPYGWMRDEGRPGYMVECPEEQKAIEAMVTLRQEGFSYRGICAELDLMGFDPRTAKEWDHKTVRKILHREGVGVSAPAV